VKITKQKLQRIIREEKVRLRNEGTLYASRKRGSISGGAGRKSRANRLRRLKEQSTPPAGRTNMKVTKTQLRRIIKEEKTKLVEQGSRALENTRHSQGMYTDITEIDAVKAAIESLYTQTMNDAMEDLGDEEMANDESIGALILTVAEVFESLGLPEPGAALLRLLR
jgi:hypothetical protein|tara:strand:+ start:38 stop:538 length:501 start_codon:yes stop_codon:yes gene_type:complete